MPITASSTVAEIARTSPATIVVFHRHVFDFCCGGDLALDVVCAAHGLDVEILLEELRTAAREAGHIRTWHGGTLAALVGHIQAEFHVPLRAELERLQTMMDHVVERHGHRLPTVLPPLRRTFENLQDDLRDHMAREDAVLFPVIVALDLRLPTHFTGESLAAGPISMIHDEHAALAGLVARMRELTASYAPPDWACPTFRGLYYGLAELERSIEVHLQLEEEVLFPRVASLAGR